RVANLRAGIEVAANQPDTGQAVDMRSRARDPAPVFEVVWTRGRLWTRHRRHGRQRLLRAVESRRHRTGLGTIEIIHARELQITLAQLDEQRGRSSCTDRSASCASVMWRSRAWSISIVLMLVRWRRALTARKGR